MLNLIQLRFLNNELTYYANMYFPDDLKFKSIYIHSKQNYTTYDGKITKYAFKVIRNGKELYYSKNGLISLGVDKSFLFYYDVSLKYARGLKKGSNAYNLLSMYEYIEDNCDKRYHITKELIYKGYSVPNIYTEYIETCYNIKHNKELIPKYKLLNSVRNVFARKVYIKVVKGYVFSDVEVYIINYLLNSDIKHSLSNSTAKLLDMLSCLEMSNVEIDISKVINVLGYNILSNYNMEIMKKVRCYVSCMSDANEFFDVVDFYTLVKNRSNKVADVYYDDSRLIDRYIDYKFIKGYVLSHKGNEFTIEILLLQRFIKIVAYIDGEYYSVLVNKNMPILYILDERVLANYM